MHVMVTPRMSINTCTTSTCHIRSSLGSEPKLGNRWNSKQFESVQTDSIVEIDSNRSNLFRSDRIDLNYLESIGSIGTCSYQFESIRIEWNRFDSNRFECNLFHFDVHLIGMTTNLCTWRRSQYIFIARI